MKQFAVLTMFIGVMCTTNVSAAYLNLTAGGTGSINGATFTTVGSTGSVGTGNFDTFLQIGATGTEKAYNTDGSAVFDGKNAANFNHSIQLQDLVIVNDPVTSAASYLFRLDINQTNSDPLLSLDELRLYTGATGDITSETFAGLTQKYSMNPGCASNVPTCASTGQAISNGVLLDYSDNAGSGNGADMFFYVPTTVFNGVSGSAYVYLYSAFGYSGGDYRSNDGFEEWGALTSTAPIPEPTTYAFVLSLLSSVVVLYKRRKSQTQE